MAEADQSYNRVDDDARTAAERRTAVLLLSAGLGQGAIILGMILVTGGTGFIGKVLVRRLVEADKKVRLLIRPSKRSPDLPRGLRMEVAVSSLADERGLRSAMQGVEVIYHLASSEHAGGRGNLLAVDIQGTRLLAQVAAEAGVERFFFLSHLGADRASAYPVLKAKAIAEEHIRRSGVNHTILRSAVVYGPGDHFTTGLAWLLAVSPLFFLVPEDGKVLLQPLWVEDLVTCLIWALEDNAMRNQVYAVGGPEYLSFNQVLALVMEAVGISRRPVYVPPPYLRALTVVLEGLFPGLPVSTYWLDYLAANRTCALDTTLRFFSLLPARFHQSLDYLGRVNWRKGQRWTMLHRR